MAEFRDGHASGHGILYNKSGEVLSKGIWINGSFSADLDPKDESKLKNIEQMARKYDNQSYEGYAGEQTTSNLKNSAVYSGQLSQSVIVDAKKPKVEIAEKEAPKDDDRDEQIKTKRDTSRSKDPKKKNIKKIQLDDGE